MIAISFHAESVPFKRQVQQQLRRRVTIDSKSAETDCQFLRLLARHPRPPTMFVVEHRLGPFERHTVASSVGQTSDACRFVNASQEYEHFSSETEILKLSHPVRIVSLW